MIKIILWHNLSASIYWRYDYIDSFELDKPVLSFDEVFIFLVRIMKQRHTKKHSNKQNPKKDPKYDLLVSTSGV